MPINKNELTKELVEKAVQCKDGPYAGGSRGVYVRDR